jgi:hypothetical protein
MTRGKLAIGAAVLVVVLAAFGWWIYQRRPSLYPLPLVGAIESMSASVNTLDRHPFDVPPVAWQPLLDSLQPVRHDGDLAKWQGLAVLNLTVKGAIELLFKSFESVTGPADSPSPTNWVQGPTIAAATRPKPNESCDRFTATTMPALSISETTLRQIESLPAVKLR